MAAINLGRMKWSAKRDKDGHRDYKVTMRVETTSTADGPERVINAAGNPIIGSPWSYGNDNDPWALCWPTVDVEPVIKSGERSNYWDATFMFSTRPLNRCQDQSIEDPLQEPDRISGSFTRFTKTTDKDRLDIPILSSSHEPLFIEKDANRPSVIIEQNVLNLELDVFSEMIDTLNDASLWGLDQRKIKLSNVPWSRKLYGTCAYYYTRRLEFEVRYEGFDEDEVADTGFKRLRGKYDPPKSGAWVADGDADAANPDDFVRIVDRNDVPLPNRVMLDNAGNVNTDPVNSPAFLAPIELYGESNFFLLNIPGVL